MIWNNGTLTDNPNILSVYDKVNLGMSVFTTLLVIGKKPLWLEDHLDRLYRHAHVMKLDIPYERAELEKAVMGLISAQQCTDEKFFYIRIQVSAGEGARGIEYPENTNTIMTIGPAQHPDINMPLRVRIETEGRIDSANPLYKIKSGNYGLQAIARHTAKQLNCDDAILLNENGLVASGTTSNVVIEKDGAMLTPPLEDGVMDGIMRAKLMQHLKCREKSMTADDLKAADHIWLVNSMGIRSVRSLDGVERPVKDINLHKLGVSF